MMRRLAIATLINLLCLNMGAQQVFTERLEAARANGAKVTLHQSARIAELVNGVSQVSATEQVEAVDEGAGANGLATRTRNGMKVKMGGYRIQVYAGGNSRQNKVQAESAATKAKSVLPGETVYTNFINPRWVCRIGDYRSFEEAYNALRTLKEAGGFGDAVIVKSKVQVYID